MPFPVITQDTHNEFHPYKMSLRCLQGIKMGLSVNSALDLRLRSGVCALQTCLLCCLLQLLIQSGGSCGCGLDQDERRKFKVKRGKDPGQIHPGDYCP